MRICFDSQIFGVQAYGGISRYFAGIAAELPRLGDLEIRVAAPLHINAYLDQLPAGMVIGQRVADPRGMSLVRRLLGAALADRSQRRLAPDIVHKTYYHAFPRSPARAEVAVTVYDLIQERFPQDFPPGNFIAKMKRLAVQKADHIFCISEHTKRDLLATYPVDESRVSVTLLGFDSMQDLPATAGPVDFRRRLFGGDRPYLLFVGRRPGYKNFGGMIKAYAASPWLREHFGVLCFGGGKFSADEIAHLQELGVADAVRQLDGSDAVLAECYRHAAVFVFPSMYEGFGIPPLEAMSVACPVVASNTSSIPEVVGDAAASFDPAFDEALRETLERVLNSDDERRELTRRGLARCAEFSWRRCAEETLKGYHAMLRQ